jgi:hypothetical protein
MADFSNPTPIRRYFVDEAGDPALFNHKKNVIVGLEGCSRYFIVGKVDIDVPDEVAKGLEELRLQLLADPYFKDVPSMQPAQKKTALGFHAKDDLAEVRREVFRWLEPQSFRFYAVVRDKEVIARKVCEHNQRNPKYRYHPNQLYDRCISGLFRERLHKDQAYKICFARRGSNDRSDALRKALEAARMAFRRKWDIESSAPIEIVEADCQSTVCLQVVDYCLWALQRFYVRGEDRFLNLLSSKIGLIHDVDDTRQSGAGEYYTQRNPLTSESRAKK